MKALEGELSGVRKSVMLELKRKEKHIKQLRT